MLIAFTGIGARNGKNKTWFKTLDKNDLNLAFNRELVRDGSEGMYILKVRKSEANLIEAIYKLYEDLDRLFKQETDELPRLYFDRHLYLPLLLEKSDKLSAAPQGLVDSEAKFVRDLKEYWEKEKDKSLKGKEVFSCAI